MKKLILGITVVAFIVILGVVGTTMIMGNTDDEVSVVKDEGMDAEDVEKEVYTILTTVIDGLKDYDVIGDGIHVDFHDSITVETLLESSDTNSIDKAIEIQEVVEDILKSKELESISYIESYQVYLLDKDGGVIN